MPSCTLCRLSATRYAETNCFTSSCISMRRYSGKYIDPYQEHIWHFCEVGQNDLFSQVFPGMERGPAHKARIAFQLIQLNYANLFSEEGSVIVE
jgi:hypothetical protein